MTATAPLRLVFLAALAIVVAHPGRAAAEEQPDDGPSPALLVGGLTFAVGGGALQYYGIHRFADAIDNGDDPVGMQWGMLASLGGLVAEVGGAMTTAWAWKLGEHDFAVDLRTGAPIQERRSLALTGLAVGAVAVIGITVGQIIVFSRTFNCAERAATSGDDPHGCTSDGLLAGTILQLAGDAVLIGVAAPMAGYGFGYDSATDAARRKRTISLTPGLLTTAGPVAALGLRLGGRF